jgi:hypothetical protein
MIFSNEGLRVKGQYGCGLTAQGPGFKREEHRECEGGIPNFTLALNGEVYRHTNIRGGISLRCRQLCQRNIVRK